MTLSDKRVLVVGAGISGVAASRLLSEEGAYVTLYDSDSKKIEETRDRLQEYQFCCVSSEELPDSDLQYELAVVSPGVPMDSDLVKKLLSNHIPVIGEIELAFYFAKGLLAAITGTNGKTTTTALTGEIMKTFYQQVFVVGNIGIPYTDMVRQTTEESVTVAEMSSFQLETIDTFRPDVSAILNITPDHLNRHHSMAKYIEAKENILKNQTADDTCVLNYEDRSLREIGLRSKCKVIWFSSKRELEEGMFLDGNNIVYSHDGQKTTICDVNELKIIGMHNYENAMAASAIAIALSVPVSCIHMALKNFTAVEHRIEYAGTKRGVAYYNDSKGTNPDASIQAVKAMQAPTYLIGGGYDKGSSYDEWIEAFGDKIICMCLMGQTAEKIAECARKHGFTNLVFVNSMEEAVSYCAEHAKSGENVLLSPCCASWGMFKNYEERGRIFKKAVNSIK